MADRALGILPEAEALVDTAADAKFESRVMLLLSVVALAFPRWGLCNVVPAAAATGIGTWAFFPSPVNGGSWMAGAVLRRAFACPIVAIGLMLWAIPPDFANLEGLGRNELELRSNWASGPDAFEPIISVVPPSSLLTASAFEEDSLVVVPRKWAADCTVKETDDPVSEELMFPDASPSPRGSSFGLLFLEALGLAPLSSPEEESVHTTLFLDVLRRRRLGGITATSDPVADPVGDSLPLLPSPESNLGSGKSGAL